MVAHDDVFDAMVNTPRWCRWWQGSSYVVTHHSRGSSFGLVSFFTSGVTVLNCLITDRQVRAAENERIPPDPPPPTWPELSVEFESDGGQRASASWRACWWRSSWLVSVVPLEERSIALDDWRLSGPRIPRCDDGHFG